MSEDLERRQRRHVLFSWAAQREARGVPITGGAGAWFLDDQGQRWLDFESQVFNCNLGHGEARVAEAICRQARTLPCALPRGVYETKAALGEALARVTPPGLDRFFLCLSGAEANENAYKIARLVTGRPKVIARRRSYHGASMGAASLTGDPRRLAVEPGLWGVLRAEDPYCYRCPFGLEPSGCGLRCAHHIEHIIEMEGPGSIAAVFLEGVPGAVGGFIPPAGYWPAVREICTRHGVLLVSDEVLSGFGRTGRWFAVDHWGVIPDMITMAKGLTGGYAPLGAVAVSDSIAGHFDDRTLWCGLTSYAHPIACAAALAAIDVYRADGLIERSAALGAQLARRLADLQRRHPIVGDARSIGLWGTLELVADRRRQTPLGEAAASRLREALLARRLHVPLRTSAGTTCLFIAPPLCIEAAALDEGLDHIDAALGEEHG